AEEARVRVIARQEEDLLGRDLLRATGGAQDGRVRADLRHARLEEGGDRAFLDAVLDVGTDPIFDRVAELRTTVHERDLRPRAVELEGGDGGRVLASHHEHGL